MPCTKPETPGSAAATLDAPCGHLCVDEESGSSFVVAPGQSILDAALQQGVPLPYGCHVGTCGACAIEVVRGEENMRPPDALEAGAMQRFGFTARQRLACRARTRGAIRIRPMG